MKSTTPNKMERQQAEQIKNACIEAARQGFMDASISGLCDEGAMEAAISAIQSLDVRKVLDKPAFGK